MSQHLDQAAAQTLATQAAAHRAHPNRCDPAYPTLEQTAGRLARELDRSDADNATLHERLASRERLLRNLADPTTATRIAGCWSRTLADVIARELAQ